MPVENREKKLKVNWNCFTSITLTPFAIDKTTQPHTYTLVVLYGWLIYLHKLLYTCLDADVSTEIYGFAHSLMRPIPTPCCNK